MDETFNKNDGVDLKDLFNAQIENIRTLINANDKNYNQRFENVIQATSNALLASDRAVSKAEGASEKRFDAVNEFRATLADQQRTLIPRSEVEIIVKSINEKIDALNAILISRQGQSEGQREGMGTIVAIAGVVSAVVAIVSRFLK